ncbi:hypothetical protein N7492_000218 [Penicillium capsulatum]|uniref:Uncharacterized protein n=1 Tax=Penicillium capsulatum TaxID=69766 RepID=A0A9W9LZT3_9EURO|nr:hypothetical protein N7492_000218 [Penicillium capsulatum]KAJ6130716.1 hypothetical protein N7512_003496 [Penicillium capsulatum]
MFSSSTRDRLRRSMSTRSMRKGHRVPEIESIDPEVAKALAASAASHAMLSSGRSSTDPKTSYDRLGGPGSVAVPRRRPNPSLQWIEDSSETTGTSIARPVTPRQSMERGTSAQFQGLENPATLPPIMEFKGLDGRDSSVPSSYRRLRKARSMFSTRQHPSPVAYGTPPLPLQEHCGPNHSPRFELPRTMRTSLIRGSNRQGSHLIRRAKSQDAAIQLARSQFLDDSESTSPQIRRSSFFLYRRKRENKPFRKTFRVTSEGAVDASSPSGQPNPRSPYSKPRTFSASIKRGFRRVFGLTKPAEQSAFHDEGRSVATAETSTTQGLPEQNLHYGSNMPKLTDRHESEGDCLHGPNESSSIQNSQSRDSLYTSTSRVTSWADSTVANTATTRKTEHRQSLSLIEEHGDLNQPLPLVPVRNDTGRQTPTRKKPRARGCDDLGTGHDLYLALMQQMGRTSEQSDEELVFGTVPEYRAIPERTSSVYSHRSRRTIRRVPSIESSASPGSFATARGDSLTPQRHARSMRYGPPPKTSRCTSSQEIHRPFSGKSLRSAYIISDNLDNDTGSAIIARFGESKTKGISPTSVYSRTTGDGTPSTNSDHYAAGPIDAEEPGTATIFASQRTAYSSPSRANGSITSRTEARPSADWQQWMSSQIERIEKASPTREHVREDAQIHDDDEVFTDMIRQVPTVSGESTVLPHEPSNPECNNAHALEPKAWSQNNFSRPFSRSSSVQTILSSQKIEPEHVVVNQSRQPHSDSTDLAGKAPCLTSHVPVDLSPMRLRTANLVQMPESPTPQRDTGEMHKRTWTQEQYRRYSARRPIANGASTQFRSMRTHRDSRGVTNENTKQQEEHDDMMSEYHKLKDPQSTISSKHMVEIFLNSRRRRADAGKPEGVGIDGAFL